MSTPTLTIKIAGRGTRLDNGETSKVGHMWYSVSDGFGNSSSYGFSPIIDNNPLNDALGPGAVNAHGSDDAFYKEISYSIVKEITQHQYELLNRFGINPSEFGFSQLYDGLDNSCVDFTWKALEIAGLNPSGHQGSFWPTHNIDDLRRFVDLSPIEIARLNRLLKDQFPYSWPDSFDDEFWTNQKRNWNRAKERPSPLTLDLDGDGVETTALSVGVYFDHNADGFAEATGWAGKDDGLLVRDLNGNGRIDSGRELFGDQTLRTSGTTATNGFEALKDLDSNADGQITSTDTAWASLQVWRDANTNGQTDTGELLGLTEVGVQSVQLAYTEHGAAVAPDAQGNQHRQTGTYTTASGITRSMNDVWFDVGRWNTQDQRTPVAVSSAIAALPDLTLPGTLGSLHQAMARDTSGQLMAAVQTAVLTNDEGTRREALTQVLFRWAGVHGVDPGSRGNHIGDARYLATLERVFAEGFLQWGTVPNPWPQASNDIRLVFEDTLSWVGAQLDAQTRDRSFYDAVVLTWEAGSQTWGLDVTGIEGLVRQQYGSAPDVTLATLEKFARNLLALGQEGADLLTALRHLGHSNGDAVDHALLNAGSNARISGSIDDGLFGGAGDDQLLGFGGNDILHGGDGNDTLSGGTGNDQLQGGAGADVYLFNPGDGQDTVYAAEAGANADTVLLGGGLTASQTTLRRVLTDDSLEIAVNGSTDKLTVWGYFIEDGDTNQAVKFIRFADGTTWDVATVKSKVLEPTSGDDNIVGRSINDALSGGAGNDTLHGLAGNDTLDGGTGNDLLIGGDGADTYLFGTGSGHDTIDNTELTSGDTDAIALGTGILPNGVTLLRTGAAYNDLAVHINGNTADVLTVKGYFSTNAVGQLRFADGTVWNVATVKAKVLVPTAGDDVIVGYESNDSLNGGAGNDILQGRGGNDVLSGGEGNDTLDGGEGNDTLDGGAGNDILAGGDGADTYRFGAGSGQDSVDTWNSTDAIAVGAGVSPNDVMLSRSTPYYHYNNYDPAYNRKYYDLTVSINGNAADMLTVKGYFGHESYLNIPLGQLRFADGTVWDEAMVRQKMLNGGAADDRLVGFLTNDVMSGGAGNDSLHGGRGNDTLDGGDGNDTLEGQEGNDVLRGGAGTDSIWGGVDHDTLMGEDGIDKLFGEDGNDTLLGGAGNDELSGGKGGDVLDGGAGNDWMDGGLGADVYVFGRGYGRDYVTDYNDDAYGVGNKDAIRMAEGIARQDVMFRKVPNEWGAPSLSIKFVNATDELIVENYFNEDGYRSTVNEIRFADGLVMNLEALKLLAQNRPPTVSSPVPDQSVVQGSAFTYVVPGATFSDPDAQDTLSYQARLSSGAALPAWLTFNPTTRTFSGTPTGTGTTTVRLTATDAAGASVFDDFVITATAAPMPNVINGTSGNDNLSAGAGSQTLNGLAGNDTLDGGAGTDTLVGGTGNDTYMVDNTGDVVTEAASAGTDLVLSSVTYTLPANVENLTLTGTTAINGTGNTLANVLTGNAGANTLDGGAGKDTLVGGAGDDTYMVDNTGDVITEAASAGTDLVQSSVTYTLPTNVENLTLTGTSAINGTGNTGANVLTGNAGANTLTGGAGNDTLDGGAGADKLVGGAGDDTYVVDNTGDVVTEAASAGTDLVQSSVTYTLPTNVENLTLTGTTTINGTGNTLANVLTGNAANNTLTGGAGNDTLDGGEGADTLVGGAGNDTYVLGRGYGADTVQENDATAGNTDLLRFNAGIATDQIWFRKSGSNLEVSIIGTSDKMTISNWYGGQANRLEQFKTSDGKTLLDTQVDALVSAMAAFSPPAAGQTTLPTSYQTALGTLLAANWK